MACKQVLQSTVENKQNGFDVNQFTIIYNWVVYKHLRGLDVGLNITLYIYTSNKKFFGGSIEK